MLNHVELQQQFGQSVERRCQRQKEREQAGLEGDQAPNAEALRKAAVELPPTAQIDGGGKQQRDNDPRLKRPRLQYGCHCRICTRRTAKRSDGLLEYWSVGSRCMIPLLHNSGTPIPVLQSLSSRVARRGRMLRPQRLHESDEGGHLLRREVLAVGRHVAAALNHLPDQLVRGQARGHAVERRAAQTAFAAETVAVPALLALQHQRALQLQWRTSLDVLRRGGSAAP